MTRSMHFDVTADGDASDLTTMARQVEGLERQLRALDRRRAEPSVRVGGTDAAVRAVQQLLTRLAALPRTSRASVALTGVPEARAGVAALVADLRRIRDTRAKVIIDTGTARADLTAIVGRLRALRDVRIRAELDDGTFARDIARLHQRVSALRGTKVRIDFEINPPGIRAELEGIAAALGRIRDTRVRVDADVGGASAEVRRLGDAMERLGKVGTVSLSIPGIVGLIGQVGSLASSALSLTGVLGLLPAAGAMGGAALATLGVGLAHVADALGPTGTPAQIKKVEEAMAALSPAAREVVTQIRGLGPAWSDVRLDVQEKLFDDLTDTIDGLANTYLPVLKTGLGGIAEELNEGANQFAGWLQQGRTVADVNTILGHTRTTMRELAPAGENVAAALLDVATVGSSLMPELATGATAATARFREFVAEARRTGELEQWIRGGMDVMGQLGRITLNTGGILGSVFSASEEAGYGFLDAVEQITGELDGLLSTTQGRTALVELFSESRDVVNELLPGVRDLAGAALDTVAAFARSDGLERFAEWVSQTATTISPLVSKLGELGGETLGALAGGATVATAALSPIVGLIGGITDVLGPVVPVAIAAVIAFKGMAIVAPLLAGIAPAAGVAAASITALFATMGTAATVGAAATSAVLGLAKALPLIAVGAVIVGQAVQAASGDLDGWAEGMIRGGDAARQARADFEAHNAQFVEGSIAAGLFSKSEAELTAEIERQISALGPLEQAQARAQIAQAAYNDAVRAFGVTSPEAIAAAGELARATDRVEIEQIAARNATDLHTAAMIQQSDQALGAVNADLAYERSLITLEQAQNRAAAAARDHGAGSIEARDAALAVEEAAFRAAAAAGEKARADGIAAGAANADQLAAQAQKDELLRLAAANSGPVRQSLLDAAAAIDIQASAASRAETLARGHKDELGRLAGQASGPLAQAMRDAAAGFDTLGGAHATAQERARLQEGALRNLANMASGPLRTELNRMADQLRNIPDAEFDVTATGRGRFAGIPSGVSTPGRLATGGVWGGPGDVRRAATGAIMPGYTPGRDVHRFVSPTGGELHLSGGEPVMRPEFGRAVGHDWIHGANRAARMGGVAGVADFLHRSAPAAERGRGEYRAGGITPRPVPVQRYAFGGLVRLGIQPMSEVVNRAYIEARDRMADHLTPLMQARIREMERAAAAAALGSAAGGGGWQWQMNVLRQRFPGLALISGFRPGAITATGNRSYHAQGRAVDVPPRMDVFDWIRGTYGGNTRELIFSPAGGRQVHNGRPHMYTGITRAQHFDHVHWAYRRGGIVPVGLGRGRAMTGRLADRGGLIRNREVAVNLSGRAERMLSARQTESFDRLVGAITGPRRSSAPAMPVLQPTSVGMGDGLLRAEMRGLRAEVRGLAAVVGDARPFVNNQTIVTADPVEAGRASVLGIRTGTRPRP